MFDEDSLNIIICYNKNGPKLIYRFIYWIENKSIFFIISTFIKRLRNNTKLLVVVHCPTNDDRTVGNLTTQAVSEDVKLVLSILLNFASTLREVSVKAIIKRNPRARLRVPMWQGDNQPQCTNYQRIKNLADAILFLYNIHTYINTHFFPRRRWQGLGKTLFTVGCTIEIAFCYSTNYVFITS